MEKQTTLNEIKTIIGKLQTVGLSSKEERILYKEIESHFTPHHINNYLYDQEEIKSEFMIAAWNALYRAKLNTGNPLMFAVRRGYGATLDYYRRISSQNLIKICDDCGAVYVYDHRRKMCTATNCKCQSFSSMSKDDYFAKLQSKSLDSYFVPDYDTQIDYTIFKNKLINIIKNSSLNKESQKMIISAIIDNKNIKQYITENKNLAYANILIVDIRNILISVQDESIKIALYDIVS